MALAYLFDPNIQNQTLGGVNNVGGFLRVYIDGTDDRATTYKDFSGTLNKADIELDVNGRAVVVVDDTKTYRMEVYSRDGFFMWSVTNLTARGSGGGSGVPVVVDGTPDEIDVTPNQVGGVMHYVVSLAAGIKSALSTLGETVNTLASSLRNKKDRQTAKEQEGSDTKTVTGFTQDENGEVSLTFGNIEFPDYTSLFAQKKDKQEEVWYSGGATRTLTGLSQDENGNITAEFDNIQYNVFIVDSNSILYDDIAAIVNSGRLPVYACNNYYGSLVNIDSVAKEAVFMAHKPSRNDSFVKITISRYAHSWNTIVLESAFHKAYVIDATTAQDIDLYPNVGAVKNYADALFQNAGGKLITNSGSPFTDESQLPSTTPYQGTTINTKDYAYVQSSGMAAQYVASVTGSSVSWVLAFNLSVPTFTTAQMNAINSGVNSTKVTNYDSHLSNTNNPHNVTAEQINALTTSGNGSNLTASFSTASYRANISTGEKLSVICGKIAKWFADLKTVAFSGSYSDLSDKPAINNGALTVMQNGVSKGVFGANQSGNTTISLTDTTYESKSAASGGTDLSLVTTGEKYVWQNKQNALPFANGKYGIDISGTADYSNIVNAPTAQGGSWNNLVPAANNKALFSRPNEFVTDGPAENGGSFHAIVIRGTSASDVTQLALGQGGNEVYYRRRTSTGWEPWFLLNSGVLERGIAFANIGASKTVRIGPSSISHPYSLELKISASSDYKTVSLSINVKKDHNAWLIDGGSNAVTQSVRKGVLQGSEAVIDEALTTVESFANQNVDVTIATATLASSATTQYYGTIKSQVTLVGGVSPWVARTMQLVVDLSFARYTNSISLSGYVRLIDADA